ncbi:multiple sugar transport system permease protein [Candidatus Hakubella thermalkaliphila]|uniref:Multiple sugar transport system permease protein n=2 Tax=Candidatus Hakubella thermalkaliphila TaxID=2754717 RepID=A0A6V8NP92_9ACTN|nr:sugar ABC transporter permease [Candidatus Hakubella thermalkaliphila]GFP21140.1 multiple sugar transport system permease protein [Candidatus Hakubella thermalkaliphila]
MTPHVFILPAVLVILALAIFPLIISLYMSFSRLRFVPGGFKIDFVGLANYRKLLVGSEKTHFLGVLADPSPVGWLVFIIIAVLLVISLARYIRRGKFSAGELVWRSLATVVIGSGVWLLVRTLGSGGWPGTVVVTLIYVFVGIFFQYVLGLGLAWLTTQGLPGRRLFRTIFLLPMMITPVGIAYLFRMLTDTGKGPFNPIWQVLGLADFSWVNHPWGARGAVMIGDIWQWTPFMFIVLLAALESQSIDELEAALVDGANRWQVFWYITLPQILPVSATLILIRMIEAFKIVDLPNVLTHGGPGTASESLTLQAYISWRTLDLGGSAAIAYMLLIIVTLAGLCFFNLIYRSLTEKV